MSVWRQCAHTKFVKSLKTSCFFISSCPQKTQSEPKTKEELSDLIFLPNSGWAHWRHVLITRLLGVLQDGGPPALEFEATLDKNFIGLESFFKAGILVSNLPLYHLFSAKRKKLPFWDELLLYFKFVLLFSQAILWGLPCKSCMLSQI